MPVLMIRYIPSAMFIALVSTLLAVSPGAASAQQPVIAVPLVGNTNPVIDGKWTGAEEWSMASAMTVNYTDGTRMVIRGMHDEGLVYVMLEMPDDYVIDGHGAICFDRASDGGPYMTSDDYCFVMGSVLREYHGDGRTTLMQQVPMDPFVSAQRALSDSASPLHGSKDHVTYEFRIPKDYLGSERTEYGFYVSFDTRGQTNSYNYYYSWPDYKNAEYLRVASPRAWGIMSLSPDATVPEFPFTAVLALAGVFGAVAILSRSKLVRP